MKLCLWTTATELLSCFFFTCVDRILFANKAQAVSLERTFCEFYFEFWVSLHPLINSFFIRQWCKYWRSVQKTLQKRTEYISLYYREIERGKGNKREMCACIHQGYWPTCMCLRYDFIYSRGQLEPEPNNKQQYHNTFISAPPNRPWCNHGSVLRVTSNAHLLS